MLANQPDWYGIAAVIAAFGGVLTSVFAFLIARKQNQTASTTQAIHDEIQTGNGRTIGQAASVVAEAVTRADEEHK